MNEKRIVVDEEEPEIDVEVPTFESEKVEVRRDRWVCDDFDIRDLLGRGKFGVVKRCSDRDSGVEFAAKFICTPRPQDKRDVEHEVKMMKKLKHKRIVQLYDAFETHSEMCIVLEIICGGELFDRVSSDEFLLTEKACICIARQICEGVAYMHSKNMIHLDLKPENIMCLSRNGNRVKIIDFGLTREYDPTKDTRVLFGTPEFMAPEVILFDPIHFATDVWSIGVMCYVLLSGLSPFMGNSDTATLNNVTTGKYDFNYPEFRKVSEEAKDFIRQLLILDKRKRATADMCLEHPWLKKPISCATNLDLFKAQMKSFVCRRKWQKVFNVIVALKRMKPKISTAQRSSFVGSQLGNVGDSSFQPMVNVAEPPFVRETHAHCNGQTHGQTADHRRRRDDLSPISPKEIFNSNTKIQGSSNSGKIPTVVNTTKENYASNVLSSKVTQAKDSKAKDSSTAHRGHVLFKQPNKNGLSNFHKLRSVFSNNRI